jgi:dTMP kinase
MQSLSRGYLISFEGIDGSGKTTAAQQVAAMLESQNIPTVFTKEPGGTKFGLLMRSFLQEQPIAPSDRAEFLLFAADRAQHMQEVVLPALREKKLVISDRMADSSLAYQGFGLGLDLESLRAINSWAMQHVEPDLTFYIRVDYETAVERLQNRGAALTAFEKRGRGFVERIIEGFDMLAQRTPRFRMIDGTRDAQVQIDESLEHIKKLLARQP